MKPFLLICIPFLLFSACSGVGVVQEDYYPDRYTLELPKGWKATPKLLKTINEMIPLAINELRDMQFCVDCKAGYKVRLELSNPVVETYNSLSKFRNDGHTLPIFRFSANFVVYDEKDRGIVMMRLIDKDKECFMFGEDPHGGVSGPVSVGRSIVKQDKILTTYQMEMGSYYSDFSRPAGRPEIPEMMVQTEKRIFEYHSIITGMDAANVE